MGAEIRAGRGPGPLSLPGRTIGVTGTAVEDTIERPDGSVTEDMGGIYYAVIALERLLPRSVRIAPVLAVGTDAVGRVRSDFGHLDRVFAEGLRPVAETNNKVHIVYRTDGEREETLTGGVPPLAWETLEPWIDRLDAWLWNFVAGNEVDLDTFARVKAAFEGPVHLDVHSLCLEHPHGGPRRPRRPERWEAWVEGTTWVQCNEREAGLLWKGEHAPLEAAEEAALAERVRGLGAEALLVTRGGGGASVHAAAGRLDAAAVDVERAVDPTGCGDVAGAAWIAFRWGHALEPGEALEAVVRVAGAAAAVSGTRDLRQVLREPPPTLDRRRPMSETPSIDTLAVHAGDPDAAGGSVTTPIHQTSTFLYPDGDRPLRYTRYGNNPTQVAAQRKLAALEGAEEALVLASGMAALATGILSVCRAGDHVVAAPDLYGGTHVLLDDELPRLGIETTYAASLDPAAWREATRPETKLWLWESISNPLLRVADGPALAAAAREAGVASMVDATFASPAFQRPIGFGVDLVMHSATKYLGGHSDLIAGALAGSGERIGTALERMRAFGGSADPFAVFLLERGIKTLPLRMARHDANGAAVAAYLADHPKVERVHHPSLADHPDRAVADRVLDGAGGVVTFVPRASPDGARALTGRFRWIRLAPSLGGVESLVSMPALTSHRSMDPAERARRGIPDQTVRLALGVEAADDLIDDLDRALAGL